MRHFCDRMPAKSLSAGGLSNTSISYSVSFETGDAIIQVVETDLGSDFQPQLSLEGSAPIKIID